MIKNILIATATLFSLGFSYAQEVKIDSRLEAKYSKSELVELQETNAKELQFLNYCIENAYNITPFPHGKEGTPEIGAPIAISDINSINFFELGLTIDDVEWQYYPIKGTDKLLVIYSRQTIEQNQKNK